MQITLCYTYVLCFVAGESIAAAQIEIEECKAELVKAKQIRKNKQGKVLRI